MLIRVPLKSAKIPKFDCPAEISGEIKGERLRFVEAMKEATAINVQRQFFLLVFFIDFLLTLSVKSTSNISSKTLAVRLWL